MYQIIDAHMREVLFLNVRMFGEKTAIKKSIISYYKYNDTIWGKCFRYNLANKINGDKINIINTTVYGEPNNLRIVFNLEKPDDV